MKTTYEALEQARKDLFKISESITHAMAENDSPELTELAEDVDENIRKIRKQIFDYTKYNN